MNRYAIIESGIVTNIAVADEPMDASWIINPPAHVKIGWHYDGSNYSAPAVYTIANQVIEVNGNQIQPFAGNYYCQPGDTVQLQGNISTNGQTVTSITVPVALKLPMVRHANGHPTTDEIYLNVTLQAGVLTANGQIPWSGDWKILIDRNNEALKRIGAQWKLSAQDITFLA